MNETPHDNSSDRDNVTDDATTEAASPALPPIVEPTLDATEARIIGCLIEKQATTPETYPLTLNAIVVACNQKSSRDPVMDLELGKVGHTVRELETKGLVAATLGARASRYEHRFDSIYDVRPRQRALLALLMLRGPQTVNELYARSERLSDFPDAAEVSSVLDRLIEREPALVVRIPHQAGQREDRYMHLLCGPIDVAALPVARSERAPANDGVLARIDQLEAHVGQLQRDLTQVQAQLLERSGS